MLKLKRGKKSQGSKNRQLILKEATLRRIERSVKLLEEGNLKASLTHLVHAVREFFGKFFKIRYQYTFSELEENLEHKKVTETIKKRVSSIAESISQLEYSQEKLTKTKLKKLISSFLKIVDDLIEGRIEDVHSQANKRNLNPFGLVMKTTAKIMGIDLKKKRLRNIYNLILQAEHSAQQGRIGYAEYLYSRIMEKYRTIPAKDKEAVFPMISRLKSRVYDLGVEKHLKNFDNSLNRIYEMLKQKDIRSCRKEYKKIQLAYEAVPEEKKKLLYPEIKDIFKEIMKLESELNVEEMEREIDKLECSVSQGNLKESERLYNRIMDIYDSLPEDTKKKYFEDIKGFYDQISTMSNGPRSS